jgi:hypothetical protein
VRTKRRVYPSDDHKQRRSGATSQSEYAVVKGKETLAYIIFVSRGKWVAVQRNGENKFGLPVSPVNVTGLRDLKAWVIERFGG